MAVNYGGTLNPSSTIRHYISIHKTIGSLTPVPYIIFKLQLLTDLLNN